MLELLEAGSERASCQRLLATLVQGNRRTTVHQITADHDLIKLVKNSKLDSIKAHTVSVFINLFGSLRHYLEKLPTFAFLSFNCPSSIESCTPLEESVN